MFTVNADGRDKKLLTRDGGISPRWSPDGRKLLFTRGDNLFVMRAGPGSVPRFLIKGPINGAAGSAGGIPALAAHCRRSSTATATTSASSTVRMMPRVDVGAK
jgi:hypothetical protein